MDKFSPADYVNLGFSMCKRCFFVSTHKKNSVVRGLDFGGAAALMAVLVTVKSVPRVHLKYVQKEVRMRV